MKRCMLFGLFVAILLTMPGSMRGLWSAPDPLGDDPTEIWNMAPQDLSQVVGAWDFDEDSGATTYDRSGNANNGTITNATRVDSEFNEYFDNMRFDGDMALYFDGIGDYVTVPDSSSLSPTSQISLEMWVKPDLSYNGLGSVYNPAKSCSQIMTYNPSSAGDGQYWFDPDGAGGVAAFKAYCDMTTDGGGWMLVMAYNHAAGTNPTVAPGTWPLSPTGSLTHVDNLKQYGFAPPSEVRLYCDTTLHSRKIHYKTSNMNVINAIYDNSVGATCSDLKSGTTMLTGHTANLPNACTTYTDTNSNQLFGSGFPMYLPSTYHWATAGSGNRWECDDLANGYAYQTNHLVWVRHSVDLSNMLGTSSNPAVSCRQIHTAYPTLGDGIYWFDPDGSGSKSPFRAYCDMTTDGGGWMLVSSYNHTAGTNPTVAPGTWPLTPTESLAHVDNITQYGLSRPSEVRLYCDTSMHSRKIHYKTTNANVISSIYDNSVAAGCADLKSSVTTLTGHSANLPSACGSTTDTDANQIFGSGFPMYLGGTYHWATRGLGSRWECDDYAGGYTYQTNHQVWIRHASSTTASIPSMIAAVPHSCREILLSGLSVGDGIYTIDPDGDTGSAPFQAYCDMTTDGGGWTLCVNSINGSKAPTTDMVSNDGTLGWTTGHVRDCTALAINQNADIRHFLVRGSSGNIINMGYTGRYHDTTPDSSGWKRYYGSLARSGEADDGSSASSVLSYHYSRAWQTSGSCVSQYGYPWYYGGCWNVIPMTSGSYCSNGPGTSSSWGSGCMERYSIFVREKVDYEGSSLLQKGTAYGAKAYGRTVSVFVNTQSLADTLPNDLNQVIMTYDKDGGSNNFKLYINGILKQQSTITGAIPVNSSSLSMGNGFRGTLDRVWIFKSALTQSEVTSRYEIGSGGLIAKWNFDTGYGTTAVDTSGRGWNGTLTNGPAWGVSKIAEQLETWQDSGNALTFDGVNDSVDLPNDPFLDGMTTFSIGAWVKPATIGGSGWPTILEKYQGSSSYDLPWIGYYDAIDQWAWEITTNNSEDVYHNTGVTVDFNRWSYIVYVFDISRKISQFYLNGELRESYTLPITGTKMSSNSSGAVGIGKIRYSGSDYWKGQIDQLEVYNRPLEAREIQKKYEEYAWGLVSRWDLDDSTGNSNAVDSGPGRNTGSLQNGVSRVVSTVGDSQGGAPTGNMLVFDGLDDYVNIGKPMPSNLRFDKKVSLEAWVKPAAYFNSSGGDLGGIIAAQWDANATCYSLSLDYRDSPNPHGGILGGVHFQLGDGGTYWATSSSGTTTTALPINVWTHVTAVAEADYEYSVYFNGQRVANWTPRSRIGYSDNCRLALGWNEQNTGSYRFFNGAIDSVRIYNSALYSQEIFYKANFVKQSGFPVARIGFPANDASYKIGVPITFTSTGSDDPYGVNRGIALYFWDFDDGSPLIRRNNSVTVTYTTPGSRRVKLWVIDNDGNASKLGLGEGLINLNITSTTTMNEKFDNLKKKIAQ